MATSSMYLDNSQSYTAGCSNNLSSLLEESVKTFQCETVSKPVVTTCTTKVVDNTVRNARAMKWLSFILLFFLIALILGLTRPSWITQTNRTNGNNVINWWALIFWSIIIALIVYLIIWLIARLVHRRRERNVGAACVKTCETETVTSCN